MSKKGILKKYRITKADGRATDPRAEYFVLRLDYGGAATDTDRAHVNACREAARVYAEAIAPWLPVLSKELRDRYPCLHLISAKGQPVRPDLIDEQNRHR